MISAELRKIDDGKADATVVSWIGAEMQTRFFLSAIALAANDIDKCKTHIQPITNRFGRSRTAAPAMMSRGSSDSTMALNRLHERGSQHQCHAPPDKFHNVSKNPPG